MAVYSDITPRTQAYAAKALLERALPQLVLEKFGQMHTLPSNASKQVTFRRYSVPIPTDSTFVTARQLTEGTTPTDIAVPTVTDVNAPLTQYGAVITVSDVIEATHEDPVLMEFMGILGENAAQIIEQMRWGAILPTTNRIYANAVAGDSTVATTITKTEIRQAIRSIRSQHGRPITKVIRSTPSYETYNIEPAFIAICNTDLIPAIRDLGAGFTPASDYGSYTPFEGEIGAFEDVRFVCSSMLGKRANAGQTVAGAASMLSDNLANINLYDVLFLGADSWGGVALKGQFAVTPTIVKATPSDSDPLAQRNKLGYKTMQTAVALQPAHMKRVTCGAPK